LEMMGMRNIGNLTSYDTSMTSATYDDDWQQNYKVFPPLEPSQHAHYNLLRSVFLKDNY
jgi:hypothetical protein